MKKVQSRPHHRSRAHRLSSLDVSNYASCEQFMKKANDYLGGIDIFVSNAAILFSGAVREMDTDRWKKVIDVNLCGFFNTAKAAVMYMKKGKHYPDKFKVRQKRIIQKLCIRSEQIRRGSVSFRALRSSLPRKT